MDNGLSAADVMALTRDEDNNMWNNPFVYLVWIWAFSAFGGGFGANRANESLTRAELCDGFNFQNVENGIRGIQNGLCDGFYALNTTNLQGFSGVDNALCQGFNGVNQNINQARFDNQQCCCETNRNIDNVRYEMSRGFCDVITAQNQNTQRILDKMCEQEIQGLRTELQSAQLALNNVAQTNTIINAVRPFPQPAYITCSPYTSTSTCGIGACGC